MRRLARPRKVIHEYAPQMRRVFRGRLAEEYDGIGQYVLVTLSGSSVSSAYKARVASGDFGTDVQFPRGTPVSVFSNHGQLEILSLGFK